jgi:DnaJ-domain-containing protein 1
MSFSESLFWFKEPGFVGILFICFLSAFFISARASKGIQIFIAAYCTVYMVTQWSKDDYFSMGLWWMYCGWAGFLFQKIGGMMLLNGIGRILKNRFDSMGRNTSQQPFPQTNQQTSSTSANRDNAYRQQQEEYRQREWQREQQKRTSQEKEEQSAKEDTPPKSKPSPDPKPKQKQKESPPPKPEPKRKRLWWEVLEVSEDADQATIKKAYRSLIQKYHPDRVSHLGEEFQVIAEEKTKEINGAFDTAKK